MIKQTFLNGRMNLQSDERLLPKGDARTMFNVRVSSSEGKDAGAIENCLGNEALTDLNLGVNAVTIGSDVSVNLNRLYWLVKSELGCYFVQYDVKSKLPEIILEDTRLEGNNILNLNEANPVQRIVIIEDSDNDQVLAAWTDGRNAIRCVNIERAKTYGANNFGQEEISLIKNPPHTMPILTLEKTTDEVENNIEEQFLRFSYGYKYLDGEYSALSSFTPIAFLPGTFNYDYSTNSNESMVNSFNKVKLTLNTGSSLVTDLRVVFKTSNSDVPYVVETFSKEEEGWGDNFIVEVDFFNNKIANVLSQDELFRLYDTVPKKAFTLGAIDNRLMVSEYYENYDLIDYLGNKVFPKLNLSHNQTTISDFSAKQSVKTLRDLEVGIVYLDDNRRQTTVLTSQGNTAFIDAKHSDKQNKLALGISHLAPSFATHYRIYIKQSKNTYDTLVPTLFYPDGQFVWIKLESGEQDKIKEGDYLIVKADSSGISQNYIETRVIEVKHFLEGDLTDSTDFLQKEGLFFKVKPDGYRLTRSDFENYEWKSYDDSGSPYNNPIANESNVIEDPIYYGNGGLNDLTVSGPYTNNAADIRYQIRIDSVGATDTFEWSDDDGVTFTSGVAITGAAQTLNNGIQITFGATTGHDANDEWIISAKGQDTNDFGGQETTKAYVVLKSVTGDIIEGGAVITMIYDEFNEVDLQVSREFISSKRYANLEEWFYGDNIAPEFGVQFHGYWFRRGTVGFLNTRNFFTQDPLGDMCMIIRSQGTQNNSNDGRAKIEGKLNIFQSSNNILFETKSNIINSDVFFELGDTYEIGTNGLHLGLPGDTSQTAIADAVINLNFFNCFAWGNGFESYKIKDRFNAVSMNIDTRPNTYIDDYRENFKKAGIIWGDRYEQTTNYNGINEFNPAKGNFIDLDDSNGAIKFLHNRGKTLVAYQENKITPLGYKKSFLYDQSGQETITQTDDIISIPEGYAGEYGISNHPESFAFFGKRTYNVDPRRGSPLRLSIDGINEINILTKDYFRDLFRNNPNATFEGGYDPYFDEYLIVVELDGTKYTMGFAENGYSAENMGWTSFYNFVPEKIEGLNNRLYTFKEGQLWLHNSDNVPRNNFYGVQYESKVVTILNDMPGEDKIFKTLVLEGNKPWDISIASNKAASTIKKTEFTEKESRWFAYVRKSESETDLRGGAAQGIGEITAINGREISFTNLPPNVNLRDRLFYQSGTDNLIIGNITVITDAVITVDSVQNTPVVGDFSYIKKSPRIEGAEIRGYYAEVTLTNDDTDFVELFAINSNISKADL